MRTLFDDDRALPGTPLAERMRPRTLEEFETLGVPVVGWTTDRFPAFYTRDSGSPVTMTVHSGAEVAAADLDAFFAGAAGRLGH